MSKLFDKTDVGTVADVREKAPVEIQITDKGGSFKTVSGSIHLLSQQVQAAADVQIDKTFADDILVTSFGQKILPLQLVCIALPPELCPELFKNQSRGVTETSLAQIYRNHHAGVKGSGGKVTRVKVAFDKVVFEGIITAMSQVPHNLSDGANFDIFRYTLSIQGNFQ